MEIAPGVRLIAAHWRVGERIDPHDVLLGMRYAVGDELIVDARREEVCVRRTREALRLSPDDVPFVRAVAARARPRG